VGREEGLKLGMTESNAKQSASSSGDAARVLPVLRAAQRRGPPKRTLDVCCLDLTLAEVSACKGQPGIAQRARGEDGVRPEHDSEWSVYLRSGQL